MKLPQPRRYRDPMKFEEMLDEGENPKGFTAQTANGTSHAFGTGWNQNCWEFERMENPPCPTAPGGRTNRTGE